MKRAPIIVSSTAVGLGLVLSFHTHKPTVARISTGSTPAGSSTPATNPGAPSSTTIAPGSSGPSATTVPSPSTTVPTARATRTGAGQDVQYRYGDIQLQVTEQGTKITNIQVLQNGAADMRSEEINAQVVPLLQSEAMSAQSAQINGISGATYTSSAYAQSLQSALDQLKA